MKSTDLDIAALEPRILELGHQLLNDSVESTSLFNKKGFYGKMMDWSMRNEAFKTRMFHFVDVLPSLRSGDEVMGHLREYFANEKGELPSLFAVGIGLGSLAPGLVAKTIRSQVSGMSKMFITGETPKDILKILQTQRQKNVGFTVDLLGELTLSEKEALRYQERYQELLGTLCEQSWKPNPLLDTDKDGEAMPQVNVSVKLSSLYSQINVAAFEDSKEQLKNRLRPIFEQAVAKKAFINVDMEHYGYKELTFAVFGELLLEPAFADYPHLGIVLQAYLRDAHDDLEKLIALSQRRDCPFTIRLVKGAYWDYEVVHADQNNWSIPVFTNKPESDIMFERCCKTLLCNHEHLRLAVGSHNVRSITAAAVMAEELGLPPKAVEFQMLYGMTEALKATMANRGHTVREYATIGELIPGMAYLVRRLLENTSNESFLRGRFAEGKAADTLLKNPDSDVAPSNPKPAKPKGSFVNEAYLDFTLEPERKAFAEALKTSEQQFGLECPVLLNGQKSETKKTFERMNPSHTDQLIAKVALADNSQADAAVAAAKAAFESWSQTPAESRADLIDKVAELILKDRYRLAAIMVHESGKSWTEADADVCEGIDFCRYYARHMRELSVPQRVGSVGGEKSLYLYQPRGVSLAISPWNFPLAILVGMVSAALVAGNTVVIKPAEQSSWIAWELMQILLKAGIPSGAVQFLPGLGEEVGEHLTGHSDIAIISFTGSKEVGMHILARAQAKPGRAAVKRCIVEMGGKNAIVVDADADLDEAVSGILYSAFGFQGEKCSACSRVIILESVYDLLKTRLVEAAADLFTGPAEDPRTFIGPLVDADAQQKVLHFIERGKKEAKLLFEGKAPAGGNFAPAAIFENAEHGSMLACEEAFGPVLALFKVADMDAAIKLANATSFGLTGAIYSRSPANTEKARREFQVGNLYINRPCTGAIVNRHPFGGVKLSGIGSKTGGPDYLLQFLDPKTIVENTLRRGFEAVEEE